jgi:hypothetical protein
VSTPAGAVRQQLPAESMQVLRNIVFAGALSDATELVDTGVDVEAALSMLVAAALIERETIIAPTPEGLVALEAWYAGDRNQLSPAAENALHAQFKPLDKRLKSLITDWQTAVARDDWETRLEVVEALTSLHAATIAFIADSAKLVPRLIEYDRRLSTAMNHILQGKVEYVARVQLDSYHTIWFQLHEDLLRILRRERDSH